MAVLAAGPSMSATVCAALRGRCHTIAVNNVAIETVDSATGQLMPALAPWADVLFASDAKWWRHYESKAKAFAGLKLTGSNDLRWPEVKRLQFSPRAPFDERPTHIVMGGNSGYQAVHIAARFGASRILLFGLTCAKSISGGTIRNHPAPCNSKGRFHQWIRNMQQLAMHLRKRGVEVVNCTPGNA